MSFEQAGPMLGDLGGALADILGEIPEDVLLYAEVGDGWQEIAIFKETATQVVYKNPDSDLFDEIAKIWALDDVGKRWTVMLYRTGGGRFTSDFIYLDDLDPEEDNVSRRRRILEEIFPDKPIDYSNP